MQTPRQPDGYIAGMLARIERSKLSDSEICRRAGIAWTTLARIRTGTSPTIRTVDKIEAVLNEHEGAKA